MAAVMINDQFTHQSQAQTLSRGVLVGAHAALEDVDTLFRRYPRPIVVHHQPQAARGVGINVYPHPAL